MMCAGALVHARVKRQGSVRANLEPAPWSAMAVR